ncbi:DUF2790 domain-containing protein [Pseudomonas sp. GD03842]|uniref:DUF2790 domain-containing protein n=1 Tax=Pseudomonas sp. GD03842 TaxID=2975385 RepID=UPI002446D64F|nr:DUF2790 domain-containing protein [Pseudomonas sp. GD03842]MDH0744996.1 DUF2790 domain-containing protein [Pseudomonas sp. GD03842]
MKYALFVTLSWVSLFAAAADQPSAATTTTPQEAQYDYSHDLDIAKIVRISNASAASAECGPVKARMEYVDSNGVSHQLEYTRLGDDCQKG